MKNNPMLNAIFTDIKYKQIDVNIEIMVTNYWGRYKDIEPETHFDPLQSFLVDNTPTGYRNNFMPDRSNRPREQHIKVGESFLGKPITEKEIKSSPLFKVYHGLEKAIPISGDDQQLGSPHDEPITQKYGAYRGISIMNKFSPLGIDSEQAQGVALVNFPSTYSRTLDNPSINYDLLLPMRTSLRFLLEESNYRSTLNTPLIFFNIGPSSGASIKYLHGQSYVIPNAMGLNSFAFRRAFEANNECLTCKIANKAVVEDHLGQTIDYQLLTVWEDDHVRIIYPYAPIRTMATRIIPKKHCDYFGNMSDTVLKSFARALTIADYLMNAAVPSSRRPRVDRTISFRQTSLIGRDFHMFVDLLPPFPWVAAETVDYVGLSPIQPSDVAEIMQAISTDHIGMVDSIGKN